MVISRTSKKYDGVDLEPLIGFILHLALQNSTAVGSASIYNNRPIQNYNKMYYFIILNT